jgi:hypothetical protein
MTDRPDQDELEELGANTTSAATAWGGARDFLSRGLKVWTRRVMGDDQRTCVRAALAACSLVTPHYPEQAPQLMAPRRYIVDMVAAIQQWLDEPTREHQERVRSMLDVTRGRHAWQDEHDLDHFWTLEAIDHASLAVWSGERSSYIVPLDYATCAARSVTCVLHSLLTRGESKQKAIDLIADAVLGACK